MQVRFERMLHRLEKAADDNVLRLSEADAAVQRAVASLERVEDGVVDVVSTGGLKERDRRIEAEAVDLRAEATTSDSLTFARWLLRSRRLVAAGRDAWDADRVRRLAVERLLG